MPAIVFEPVRQQDIAVTVDFYTEEEKKKLLEYPTSSRMLELVRGGAKIPVAEFLAHYLFHQKRPGVPGYRSLREVGTRINQALIELDPWVVFDGLSIHARGEMAPLADAVAERVGEAVGLSVINRVHRFTEADWNKIQEEHGKDAWKVFDYGIGLQSIAASDGKDIVQVGTKGTVAAGSKERTSTLRAHKKSIADKKVDIRAAEAAGSYPYPADLRYGTITVLGKSPSSPLHCWLVDPDGGEGSSAAEVRILHRVSFLRDWISFVAPRSPVATALSTRLGALLASSSLADLDGIELLNGLGERIQFEPFAFGRPNSFFASKSVVTDGPAGGVVFQLSPSYLMFLGFQEDLLFLAANQSFDEILAYRAAGGSVNKTVMCSIPSGRFKYMRLPDAVRSVARESGGYVRFRLFGQIHYSPAGLAFGVLPMDGDLVR